MHITFSHKTQSSVQKVSSYASFQSNLYALYLFLDLLQQNFKHCKRCIRTTLSSKAFVDKPYPDRAVCIVFTEFVKPTVKPTTEVREACEVCLIVGSITFVCPLLRQFFTHIFMCPGYFDFILVCNSNKYVLYDLWFDVCP